MTNPSSGRPAQFLLIHGDLPPDTKTDENPFPLGGGPEIALTPEERRRQRRSWPRTLRSYERMAHVPHWCDECCMTIEPGDFYAARVVVTQDRKQHRLRVDRKHIDPPCPRPPPWEKDEFGEDHSRVDDSSRVTAVA